MTRRPGWLARSWWTGDRVRRAALVLTLVSLTLRMGRDDHPAAPAAAWVVLAMSAGLYLSAAVLLFRERRSRRELTRPWDPRGR